VDSEYASEVARTRKNDKFLPGAEIPEDLLWTGSQDEALEGANEYYSVIPTQFIRATVESFDGALSNLPGLSCSKGLELDSFQRPSEILTEAAGANAGIAVLSGPSHAEETAFGQATSVVIASEDSRLAEHFQGQIAGPQFRVYSSPDLVGVELGGALKNIIAVAAGIADGIGLGDNAKAALVSRGLVEMGRLGKALGAQRETFFGLSGAGDLMVTCYSRHSRNRSFGERIGQGDSLDTILKTTQKVAEGVWTCQAVHRAAQKTGVEMPITEALHAILFDEREPKEVVRQLMARPTRPELDQTPS
jgi:glycerol-3-phosphate dehydrogenase (NAD(P)+)